MIRQLRAKVFYGYWILSAGFIIQLLTSALLQRSYSAYVLLLGEEFGWSKTALSGAYSLQQVENGLLGPLQGWVVDRFGPRANIRVGLICFAIGFIILSQINSLFMFYLAFVFLAIGASVSGFFPFTVTIVNWFVRRRASTLSIMSLGFATGGMLVPLTAFALDEFGWRATAFGSGILILVVGMPLVQVVRHRPEPYGLRPDGDPPPPPGSSADDDNAGQVEMPSFTAREALRTWAFWAIALGHGSALLIVASVNVHVITHLNESLGYSLAAASFAVTLMTGFQVVGLLLGGFLGDRFNKTLICGFCMLLHASGMLMVAYAGSFPMVVAFGVLHGLAWGIRGPLMAAIRADYFGTASFGVIMGFASMIATLGNISGPLIAGRLADITGSYETGFTVLAVMASLGSLFFFLARKPEPPGRVVMTRGTTAAAAEH